MKKSGDGVLQRKPITPVESLFGRERLEVVSSFKYIGLHVSAKEGMKVKVRHIWGQKYLEH